MASLQVEKQIPTQTQEDHPSVVQLTPEQESYVDERLDKVFPEYWGRISPNILVPGNTDLQIVQRYGESYAKEERVVAKTYGTVMALAERHKGPISLLFDGDKTAFEWVNNQMVMRPSIPLVVEMLHEELGERFTTGMLSTKYRDDEDGLKVVANSIGYAEDRFILSTTEAMEKNPELKRLEERASTEEKMTQPCVQNLVDSEIIKLTELKDERGRPVLPSTWFDSKLIIVNDELSKPENSDRAIVVADDFPYAGVIKTNHDRAAGIYLRDEIQSSILWPDMLAVAKMQAVIMPRT